MSEAEVIKIVQSLGPSWIDITRTIALVVLALTAIFTAKFALKQAENAVRQAHAGFLLELDRRWEGHEMIESRVEYNKLSEEIKNDIFNNFSQLSHKDMELKEEELFEKKFHEIKNGNVNRYAKLMRLCGVFETVGFLVNRKFVMFSEINDLFHGSIIPVGAAFEKHIKKRDETEGRLADGIYRYALGPCGELEKESAIRSESLDDGSMSVHFTLTIWTLKHCRIEQLP